MLCYRYSNDTNTQCTTFAPTITPSNAMGIRRISKKNTKDPKTSQPPLVGLNALHQHKNLSEKSQDHPTPTSPPVNLSYPYSAPPSTVSSSSSSHPPPHTRSRRNPLSSNNQRALCQVTCSLRCARGRPRLRRWSGSILGGVIC